MVMEGGEAKAKAKAKPGNSMDTLTALIASLLSSKLLTKSPLLSSSSLLRHYLLLLLHLLLSLFSVLLSLLLGSSRSDSSPKPAAQPEGMCAARALSHVLAVVARVPVASRKYELVRSLAERILDDNLRCDVVGVNRGALSEAFGRTLRRLEAAVAAAGTGESGVEAVVGKVRRWWWAAEGEEERESGGAAAAEKMAAELMWLGRKMAESGVVEEAVERWSAAEGLGRRAVAAEPRLQAALVRVAVFLFKHANSKQFEGYQGGEGEEERAISDCRMAMLMSWLPLLCRASNGTDAPVLSSRERAEMVRALEEMIEKLTWEQQEEVLALWLHHFTLCPDSDWPNLESSYTRWYSESRKILMK